MSTWNDQTFLPQFSHEKRLWEGYQHFHLKEIQYTWSYIALLFQKVTILYMWFIKVHLDTNRFKHFNVDKNNLVLWKITRHLSITSTLNTFFHFGCLQLSLSDGNVSWFMAQLKMECLLLVKVEMCRQAGKN